MTTEPATVVPGVASQSVPTRQPFADVPLAMPISAVPSVERGRVRRLRG